MKHIISLFLFLCSFHLCGVDHPNQLPLQVYDEAFAKILGERPKLHQIATGFGFTEGPVYFQKGETGYLIFTDQIHDNINMIRWNGLDPFNEISKLSYSEAVLFRHPTNIADGQTADLEGRLLTCETTGRRVSITQPDGKVETLAGMYEGKPLNSPNDVIVKSDGSVWFTDPNYGCLQFPQECYLPNHVYRYDPETKKLTVVADDLKMPNGLAFSPDESLLYICDSALIQAPMTDYVNYNHRIMVYDVVNNGTALANPRPFVTVTPGFPDGMRLDADGNIYAGAMDGIQVFNPEGKLIGKILMPKETANLTFGGKENNILFICSSDSVWAIKLNAKGAKPVPFLK